MYIEKQEFKGGRVIHENEFIKLYRFGKASGQEVPVFVVPPHAGRHGNIAQRIIDRCVAAGKEVYAYELLPATSDTCKLSIQGLIVQLATCQRAIGRKVDLVCLCQGAWLGAIFTSLFQDKVNRYCNFAGPINTQTGEDNIIEKYMRTPGVVEYQKMVVQMNGGIQRGYLQWLAFSFVDPFSIYCSRWSDYLKMLILSDREGIATWEKNNSWYDSPVDIAGTWFLECLEWHFRDNRLFSGTFPKIGGRAVDLSNITCDIYLFAGDADDITHPSQVFDMEYAVSSANVTKVLFPNAGHTKVFVGSDELETFINLFFK